MRKSQYLPEDASYIETVVHDVMQTITERNRKRATDILYTRIMNTLDEEDRWLVLRACVMRGRMPDK